MEEPHEHEQHEYRNINKLKYCRIWSDSIRIIPFVHKWWKSFDEKNKKMIMEGIYKKIT